MDKKEKLAYVALGVFVDHYVFKPAKVVSKVVLFAGGVAVGLTLNETLPALIGYISGLF